MKYKDDPWETAVSAASVKGSAGPANEKAATKK